MVDYTITDHWLDGVRRVYAAEHGGTLLHPELIILHYTAGSTMTGAVATLTRPGDPVVSCHLIVGPEGELVQCASFRTITYHAGASFWKGKKGCNSFSIGIELVNPGYARPGVRWAHTGTIRAAHPNGGPVRDWYTYPEAQLEVTRGLVRALRSRYGALEVVGHDMVAPGRKIDPGPALDLGELA